MCPLLAQNLSPSSRSKIAQMWKKFSYGQHNRRRLQKITELHIAPLAIITTVSSKEGVFTFRLLILFSHIHHHHNCSVSIIFFV